MSVTHKSLPRRFRPYPEYKDSGVEWLGEIPAHWEVKRLKHVARLQTGGTPQGLSDDAFDREGVPWVKPEDLLGDRGISEPNRKLAFAAASAIGPARSGALLVCGIGTVGKFGIAPQAVCTNQQINSITLNADVEDRYGAFTISCLEQEFISRSNKVTIAICNKTQMGEGALALPPLLEQRAVAWFLDRETGKIDALVAEKERLIELLREKRTALITRAVTKGLDPNVPMKDSGVKWLGDIPAHWDVRRLAMAVSKITNGYVGPTRDILVDDGVRYLQSLHIKNGSIDFDRRPYYVTESWNREHAKSVLREGDVLVVQTGDIGQVAAVPKEYAGCNCHALIILELKKGLGTGFYLARLLQSDYGRNTLHWAQTGALHPHLECGHVREVRILLPPAEEQDQILRDLAKSLADLDSLLGKIVEGIDRLKELRTALISAAVTGKIDVRQEVA